MPRALTAREAPDPLPTGPLAGWPAFPHPRLHVRAASMARTTPSAATQSTAPRGPGDQVGVVIATRWTGAYCLEDRASWRELDGGHTPAVEHREPISMAGAKHTGVFRKGLDDSLDDLALVAVILNPDVKLVATHKANPQHNLCHAQSTSYLSRSPNPVADHPSASVGPGQRNSIKTSRATRRRYERRHAPQSAG